MTEKKITLGQAIDQIINALEGLDESAKQTAINAACQHTGINSSVVPAMQQANAASVTDNSHTHVVVTPAQPATSQMDIRSLKEQKAPASASQMACVVAYYLQELAPENERKDTVNAKDLQKYFKQAKYRLPKTIQQLLPDSRASGYFDSAAGKGEYALNAVGYNLVAHNLPKENSK